MKWYLYTNSMYFHYVTFRIFNDSSKDLIYVIYLPVAPVINMFNFNPIMDM